MKYEVGDLIVPADGSSYVGKITYISKDEDTVRHKCLKTGTEYEKSYYGFPVRYMSIVEMLEWSRKLSKENADLHTKLILASGGDEAVRAAVANTDACWRMEQEVIVRQRDEARRDLGEILAIIHRDGGHYTGEHGISKSVADAHATWAAVMAERDALLVRVDCLRGAIRKLLLSRDAAWTGGHDWQEAVDDAVKALGMEVDG